MLQVAGGKWQVATGECQRTLCCVFSPIHAAFACETISTALQLRVATMSGWGNGDTPAQYCPFFFTVSSPVLCKLLLWQHVALVFMTGWPGSVHFQLG